MSARYLVQVRLLPLAPWTDAVMEPRQFTSFSDAFHAIPQGVSAARVVDTKTGAAAEYVVQGGEMHATITHQGIHLAPTTGAGRKN